MQITKNSRIIRAFPLTLALGLAPLAQAASYNSVDITLKKGSGPFTVGLSTRVSPTLGVVKPPIKNGVAYVGASQDVGVWNVGLSPKLPLSLNITQQTGNSTINLKGLPVTRLNLSAGAGPIELQLPSRTLTASVKQETGSLEIYLPADTGLKLVIQKFETGSLTIEDEDTAVGTNLKGTFQTANYDSAKYKITLNLTHGTGPVNVYKPGTKGGDSAASSPAIPGVNINITTPPIPAINTR